MLTSYLIAWPGIPPNSSYYFFAHVTQQSLTNDRNYDMWQPLPSEIQRLCIFCILIGTILLLTAFHPSTTKRKKNFTQKTSHTHTQHLQEYSKRVIYCKEDNGYLQILCVQGIDLFIPFIIAFIISSFLSAFFYTELQGGSYKFRSEMFGTALAS